jgi:hypothetical protein
MDRVMTDEVEGVLLTDGRSRVFLHRPEPYADGHGYHHRVDLVGGPFAGTIDASSYEGPRALLFFHKELVALCERLKGEAHLPNSYENLRLSLRGDGLGHIAVQVEAHAVVQTEGTVSECLLSFGFAIDQTQLATVIATVDRWLANDPVSDR